MAALAKNNSRPESRVRRWFFFSLRPLPPPPISSSTPLGRGRDVNKMNMEATLCWRRSAGLRGIEPAAAVCFSTDVSAAPGNEPEDTDEGWNRSSCFDCHQAAIFIVRKRWTSGVIDHFYQNVFYQTAKKKDKKQKNKRSNSQRHNSCWIQTNATKFQHWICSSNLNGFESNIASSCAQISTSVSHLSLN